MRGFIKILIFFTFVASVKAQSPVSDKVYREVSFGAIKHLYSFSSIKTPQKQRLKFLNSFSEDAMILNDIPSLNLFPNKYNNKEKISFSTYFDKIGQYDETNSSYSICEIESIDLINETNGIIKLYAVKEIKDWYEYENTKYNDILDLFITMSFEKKESDSSSDSIYVFKIKDVSLAKREKNIDFGYDGKELSDVTRNGIVLIKPMISSNIFSKFNQKKILLQKKVKNEKFEVITKKTSNLYSINEIIFPMTIKPKQSFEDEKLIGSKKITEKKLNDFLKNKDDKAYPVKFRYSTGFVHYNYKSLSSNSILRDVSLNITNDQSVIVNQENVNSHEFGLSLNLNNTLFLILDKDFHSKGFHEQFYIYFNASYSKWSFDYVIQKSNEDIFLDPVDQNLSYEGNFYDRYVIVSNLNENQILDFNQLLLPKVEISYRLPLEFRKKLRNKGFPDFLISCSYGISHFFNIQGTYNSSAIADYYGVFDDGITISDNFGVHDFGVYDISGSGSLEVNDYVLGSSLGFSFSVEKDLLLFKFGFDYTRIDPIFLQTNDQYLTFSKESDNQLSSINNWLNDGKLKIFNFNVGLNYKF